jgi:predicted  nucleic acid-binding Zn ribbon protein
LNQRQIDVVVRITKAIDELKLGEKNTSCECPRCHKTIQIKKTSRHGFIAKCETPHCVTVVG